MRKKSEAVCVLGRALGSCRRQFRNAAISSALLNFLYLAPSIYMLQVYDRVVPTRGVATLLALTAMLLLATAVIASLDLFRNRLLIRATAQLDRAVTAPLLRAVMTSTEESRRLRHVRDFDVLRQALSGSGVLALFDAPWAPIYVFICFLLHPALGILALGGAAVLCIIAFLNDRASRTAQQEAGAAQQIAMLRLEATVTRGASATAGIQEGLLARHAADRMTASRKSTLAAIITSRYSTLSRTLRQLLQSLAVGVGAFLAIEQSISTGAIFAVSLLVARALAPIDQITASWRALANAREAYLSLRTGLGAVPAADAVRLPDMQGNLAVRGLTVIGSDGRTPILRNISFDVPKGTILGIVGPNGAGKSTLARAIVGSVKAEAGDVRIDGALLADWPENQRAASVGYVPQQPSLLPGTIIENISRFETGDSLALAEIETRAVAAAMAAGAHEAIIKQPGSYARIVGQNSSMMSPGQTQQIALARAIYGTPSLIILDEPYANMDAQGEAALTRLLDQLKKRGCTVLVIAHRFSVLEQTDALLLLRDGQMETFGATVDVLGGRAAPDPAKMPDPSKVKEAA